MLRILSEQRSKAIGLSTILGDVCEKLQNAGKKFLDYLSDMKIKLIGDSYVSHKILFFFFAELVI